MIVKQTTILVKSNWNYYIPPIIKRQIDKNPRILLNDDTKNKKIKTPNGV